VSTIHAARALSRQTWISATFILVLSTLLSKALGLVRDILVASYFGAGHEVDAFTVAVAPATLAGGIGAAVGSALIPLYRRRLGEDGARAASRLAGAALTVTVLCSVVLMVMLLAAPRLLIEALAPSLPDATANLAAELARWLAALVLGLNMIYVLSAVYNALEHFKIPAFMDLGSNICLLVALVSLSGVLGIKALALGLGAGTLFVVAALILPVWSRGVIMANYEVFGRDARELARLAGPVFLFEAVSQATGVVENFLGARLEAGSIAAIGYAKRLSVLVVSLLAVNIARAVFPALSKLVAEARLADAQDLFVKLTRQYMVVFVPVAFLLADLSHAIVRAAFMRGAFHAEAAERTASVLFFYAVGVVPVALIPVCIRACYAFSDGVTPVVAMAMGLVCVAGLGLLLTPALGARGVALASSAGILPGVALMMWRLSGLLGGLEYRALLRVGFRAVFCSACAFGAAALVRWTGLSEVDSALTLPIGLVLYLVVYLASGWVVMRAELRTLWTLLWRGH